MIYAIGCKETGRVKFGFTSGISAYDRLKAMQTGSPTKLEIISEYEEGTRKQEQAIHDILYNIPGLWLHGEWFAYDRSVCDVARVLHGYDAETRVGRLVVQQLRAEVVSA